jgi:hypothetical protein
VPYANAPAQRYQNACHPDVGFPGDYSKPSCFCYCKATHFMPLPACLRPPVRHYVDGGIIYGTTFCFIVMRC